MDLIETVMINGNHYVPIAKFLEYNNHLREDLTATKCVLESREIALEETIKSVAGIRAENQRMREELEKFSLTRSLMKWLKGTSDD